MANLEDKEAHQIADADFDTLIGREENQRLEFKETIEGVPNPELAKDIGAMTNADRGYIIIGAIEDNKSKRCSGFRTVKDPDGVRTRIKDIALQYVRDRLTIAPESRKTTRGEIVILVPIPKSLELRAVEY
jgi:predicted HTH transcriptional regulator